MNSIFFMLSEIVILSVFLGFLGIFIMPSLRRAAIPVFKETYLSDFLPFNIILEDQKTILCRDGKLCRVFEIKGAFLQNITDDENHFFFSRLQSFFDAMAERGAVFRLLTRREHVRLADRAEFDIPLLHKIHSSWNTQFQECFQTKHYLIIQTDKETEMKDISNGVMENLSVFRPECLEARHDLENENALLSFLSSLVNMDGSKIFASPTEISEVISTSQILFHLKEGLIEIREGAKTCFYCVVGIKRWGSHASSEILNDLLHLPMEFEILHHFKGFKKLDAAAILRYRLKQENLMFQNFFKNEEFETAIQNLEAGNHTLYDYQMVVFIKGQDRADLLKYLGDVRKVLLNHGIMPIQECDPIEWLWFSRFPSFDVQMRPRSLFSNNLAALISFEENAQGLSKCDWGDGPLRYFKTVRGNAYALQVHVSERPEALAHSLTIAPSESGKTTLFQHLIGGALRHNKLHAYIFDRFNGTRIFTEAMNGSYIDLSTPGSFEINPLQCSDTPQNRAFLMQFLLNLSGSYDDTSLEMIGRAVDFIFKIPISQRSLKSIFSYAFDTQSMVKKGLKKWVEGPYGSLLNGPQDNLDFSSTRLMAFEMTEIQKDPILSTVLTDYILHRIRSQVRARAAPHFIFIDETAPLLEDSFFIKHVQILFREHRKLRGSINVCFQDAQGLFKSPISETILNQCQTIFLFQNIHGKLEDYAPLNLTNSEWAFVKGVSRFSKHVSRGVLVKKGRESLILDVDMGVLGKYLNVYKSGTEPLKLMWELKELWGDGWVEHYLDYF